MPNFAWAIILIALLAVVTMVLLRTSRSTFLVGFFHNIVWTGAIILVGSNLIQYKEASTVAWLTLTSGIVCFNLGVWMANRMPKREAPRSWLEPQHRIRPIVNRPTLVVLLVVYSLAFAIYLWTIAIRFGLLTLITNPESIRGASGESYLQNVPLLARLALFLGPFLFAIFAFKTSIDRPVKLGWRLAALVFLTMSMLALLQRTNLFMGILWVVAILLSQSKRESQAMFRITSPKLKRVSSLASRNPLIVLVAVLLFVAFAAFQVLGGALGKNASSQAVSTGNVSPALQATGLVAPFAYYSGGIPAFLQLVDSNNSEWPPPPVGNERQVGDYNPQTWGAATFAPVLKVIPVTKPWDDIDAFIDMGILINVFTWLETYYRDFRIGGVIVGTALMGYLIGILYKFRFRSVRMFWLQAAFVSTIFLATFTPKITNTQFLSELMFVGLLTLKWPENQRSRWISSRATDSESTPEVL